MRKWKILEERWTISNSIVVGIFIVLIMLLIINLALQDQHGNIKAIDVVKKIEQRDRTALEVSIGPTPMTEQMINERLKNFAKHYNRFIEIAKDIDKCKVVKTTDPNNYVITLIDSSGRETSLWITDGGRVKTITPY